MMEEEKKKVNTGIVYKNGKYRPNVFFDKSMQAEIEKHFRGKGYKTLMNILMRWLMMI